MKILVIRAVITAKNATLTNSALRRLICVITDLLSTIPNSPRNAGMIIVAALGKFTFSLNIISIDATKYIKPSSTRIAAIGLLTTCLYRKRWM
jgi:hypothetical protein